MKRQLYILFLALALALIFGIAIAMLGGILLFVTEDKGGSGVLLTFGAGLIWFAIRGLKKVNRKEMAEWRAKFRDDPTQILARWTVAPEQWKKLRAAMEKERGQLVLWLSVIVGVLGFPTLDLMIAPLVPCGGPGGRAPRTLFRVPVPHERMEEINQLFSRSA